MAFTGEIVISMDELNFFQFLLEKGANLSNIAELYVLYHLLKAFIARDKKVEQIEKSVGSDMVNLGSEVKKISRNVEIIKKISISQSFFEKKAKNLNDGS